MADVVFCQRQKFFEGGIVERWARVVIYEDEHSDCLETASPLLFMFQNGRLCNQIPVGISETEEYSKVISDYMEHKDEIVELLQKEKLNPQVILYTTPSLIKEAFYRDYTESMELKVKVTKEKELCYFAACGEQNCALLVAFEDLSVYKEDLKYLEDNFYQN